MILIVFFAIWILPEGPEKTRYRCFGFGWWNFQHESTKQRSENIRCSHITSHMKVDHAGSKGRIFGRTARELLQYRIKKGKKIPAQYNALFVDHKFLRNDKSSHPIA